MITPRWKHALNIKHSYAWRGPRGSYFTRVLSLSLLFLRASHVFPALILNVPALNNNGTPWKWDYSKTFASFLPSTPFVAIHSSSRIMTRRVYGSSAVAFNEARPCHLRLPSSFCPSSFFRRFNCCANICLAGIDPGPTPRQRNYVQGKVYPRFRSSFRPRREREREIALLFSSLVGIVDFERNFIC